MKSSQEDVINLTRGKDGVYSSVTHRCGSLAAFLAFCSAIYGILGPLILIALFTHQSSVTEQIGWVGDNLNELKTLQREMMWGDLEIGIATAAWISAIAYFFWWLHKTSGHRGMNYRFLQLLYGDYTDEVIEGR